MLKDKSIGPSRRAFLKTSGLAAVSSVLIDDGVARAGGGSNAPSSASVESRRDPVDWVNLLQGSASTPDFSRGNTLPIGMTILGRAWSEPVLIKLAFAYEQATHHRHAPPTTQRSSPRCSPSVALE